MKPIIGIASTWSNVTPCNMHIDKPALEAEKGTNAAGGKAIIFNTITISDGISMGSEGMKYSFVSREVIADSIKTVVGFAGMDGYIAIGGRDKKHARRNDRHRTAHRAARWSLRLRRFILPPAGSLVWSAAFLRLML